MSSGLPRLCRRGALSYRLSDRFTGWSRRTHVHKIGWRSAAFDLNDRLLYALIESGRQ